MRGLGSGYDQLFTQLRTSEYLIISDPLAGCGSTNPRFKTVVSDADYIRETL